MNRLAALVLALLALAPMAPGLACSTGSTAGLDPVAMKKEAYRLDRMGEFKDAAEGFRKVIAHFPDDRRAHYYLANTLWRDDQIEASRREWEVVLRMNPHDIFGHEARRWLRDRKALAHGAKVVTYVSPEAGYVDGPVATSRFRNPSGLTMAGTGNLYVADTGNHRLRRINTRGVVSTVAGTGEDGYADGPAARARLQAPRSLTIDPVGNLYFTDLNRVRFLTPTGRVGTLAGSAEAASRDGDGANARLDHPTAIVNDRRGTVYVAEGRIPAIRAITSRGDVRLLAGGASEGLADGRGAAASFRRISALTLGPDGALWVVDDGNNRLRRVTLDGVVTTPSACPEPGLMDGPRDLAQFTHPGGLVTDASGNFYLADTGNHAIRRITPRGWVETVAGGAGSGNHDGKGIFATFYAPADLVLRGKTLFVLDRRAHDVRRIDLTP